MKKFILIIMICALLSVSYALCLQMSKKPKIRYIEPTTTSESTTSSTTTTTTTKTTKKTTKTTKKKTTNKSFSRVATASISEYQNYAKQYGNYDETQMGCLITLWNRESSWNPNSFNKKSGACGIPQSLPCNKIYKQQGSYDWQSQIKWGINRINYKYGSPCEALKTHNRIGWY